MAIRERSRTPYVAVFLFQRQSRQEEFVLVVIDQQNLRHVHGIISCPQLRFDRNCI